MLLPDRQMTILKWNDTHICYKSTSYLSQHHHTEWVIRLKLQFFESILTSSTPSKKETSWVVTLIMPISWVMAAGCFTSSRWFDWYHLHFIQTVLNICIIALMSSFKSGSVTASMTSNFLKLAESLISLPKTTEYLCLLPKRHYSLFGLEEFSHLPFPPLSFYLCDFYLCHLL